MLKIKLHTIILFSFISKAKKSVNIRSCRSVCFKPKKNYLLRRSKNQFVHYFKFGGIKSQHDGPQWFKILEFCTRGSILPRAMTTELYYTCQLKTYKNKV